MRCLYFWQSRGREFESPQLHHFLLFALVLCLVFVLCDLFNPQKFANVIMVDGPSPTSHVLFKISEKEKQCGGEFIET